MVSLLSTIFFSSSSKMAHIASCIQELLPFVNDSCSLFYENFAIAGASVSHGHNSSLFMFLNSYHNNNCGSKERKMAKIRNQYNQVPHLTQDITWESDKITIRHHKQKPRGQPFPSRKPQGSNEQTPKYNKHNT